MDLQLTGKTALVAGATAGIGLAIARSLAAEGAHIVICGRSQQNLKEAASKIGGNVRSELANSASTDGAAALLAAVPDVDILVNNLGID